MHEQAIRTLKFEVGAAQDIADCPTMTPFTRKQMLDRVAALNQTIAALKNAEVAPSASANSDYAAALKIYHEYVASGVSTIDHFVTFPSWCEERLNALKAAHCA